MFLGCRISFIDIILGFLYPLDAQNEFSMTKVWFIVVIARTNKMRTKQSYSINARDCFASARNDGGLHSLDAQNEFSMTKRVKRSHCLLFVIARITQ